MSTHRPNIVQAEFFHVGGNENTSLNEIVAEGLKRVGDGLRDILAGAEPSTIGTGFKTCVRFYDTNWTLTNLVKRAEWLNREHIRVLEQSTHARGIRKWLLVRKFRKLLRELSSVEKRKHALSVKELKASIKSGRPIGIEQADRGFRAMRKNEAHELVEAVENSHHIWLFLFKHNDLFADKNVGIGHAM